LKTDIRRAIQLIFTHTPDGTVVTIPLIVVLGLLPLAGLYIMKLLVDTVTLGITTPDKHPCQVKAGTLLVHTF